MHEVKLIRLVNGQDVVAELVSETKTSVTLKNTVILDLSIDEENTVLMMYSWLPYGSSENNEVKLNKRDVLLVCNVKDNLRKDYIENTQYIFNEGAEPQIETTGNVVNFNRARPKLN